MKKQLVSILCLMFTFLAVTAQDVMVINKTDGTKTTVPVVKIQDITFADAEDNSIIISDKSLASTTSFTIQYTVNTTLTVDQIGIKYGLGESASANTVKGTVDDKGVGSITVTGLDFEKTYYVKAYAMINGETYTSDIATVVTPNKYPVASDMVDLGLSVKWASCNMGGVVDANTGCFLPWGDITGESYNASTYPKQTISVSCISGTSYDIVTAKWGGKWRLPTADEFQELWDNTTHEQISGVNEDGYYAMKLTSKKNGRSIILAKGGFMENLVQYKANEVGFYWTGDIKTENNGYPTAFAIQSPTNGYATCGAKYLGCLIRPVYGDVSGGGSSSENHDYVDLGIVNLWSPVNYGAASQTDPGKYLAWGENSSKDSYTPENYKYYNDGSYNDITTLQSKSIDVVANEWKGSWHMPTFSQMSDLINNCVWTWTTIDGVNGYKVSGKSGSGCESNFIFLPVSGVKFQNSTLNPSEGFYWSGEQYRGETNWGYYINFDSTTKYIDGAMKYRGLVIRPCRDR